MGRKKKEDMAEFQDWLVEDLYLADSSACVYASNVRATLDYLPDLQDEALVTEGFVSMSKDLSRRALSSRKSAWKKFAAYALTKGVTLALPADIPNHRGPPALPHPVRAALAFLNESFQQKQIAALTWAMFKENLPSASHVPLQNPFSLSETVDVLREHVEALKEWSGYNLGQDGPLIPWKIGATIPYPAAAFRRELRLYRKDAGIDALAPLSSGAALDRTARAEADALLAARQGVRVHGGDAPDADFVASHTTQALVDLMSKGTPLPGADNMEALNESDCPPKAGSATGVGEESPQKSDNALPHAEACTVCGYPPSIHAEAFNLTDGTISNCAVENGYPEDTCNMCDRGCYGRHEFRSVS